MSWNIAQARQHFSDVVKQAADEPQLIYNRERRVAAVINAEQFSSFQTWRQRQNMKTGVLAWAAKQPTVGVSAVTVEESIYGLTRKANRRLLDGFEALIAEQCHIALLDELWFPSNDEIPPDPPFSKGGAALAAGGFCSFPQLRSDCYIFSHSSLLD